MLPPGCIILDKNHFFYYDNHKSPIKAPMHEAHYHNFYEIYYLLSGECDYLIGDTIYSIEQNGLIFIPENVIHKTVYKTDDFERIVISFTHDYINPLLAANLTDVLVCNQKNKSDIEYIHYIFNNMRNHTDYEDEISNVLLNCYVTQVLLYMAENFSKCAINGVKKQSPIDNALTSIAHNYAHNITLEQIAFQSGYHSDYFSNMFKKHTGIGFKEYLLLTRLNAAEKLLTTTTKSIKEISILCGFNDSNYFSTAFRKFYNYPPTEYKKIKNLL